MLHLIGHLLDVVGVLIPLSGALLAVSDFAVELIHLYFERRINSLDNAVQVFLDIGQYLQNESVINDGQEEDV